MCDFNPSNTHVQIKAEAQLFASHLFQYWQHQLGHRLSGTSTDVDCPHFGWNTIHDLVGFLGKYAIKVLVQIESLRRKK
jgi:hypothetical protein